MSTLYSGNHTELKQIVKRIYQTKLPLFVHGTFGIGKTVCVREATKELASEHALEFSDRHEDINDPKKFCFIPLILHHYDAGEIKGIPFPDAERKHTVYLPVGLLPEKGQGVIFLDEMNLAAPMMQNNGYQLIEDRRLGDYKVPEGYICIGAGNLVDDRGNTYDMPMPLNNRFLHFQLNPPLVEDWVNNYAIPHKLDYRIMNYLQYSNSSLYAFQPDATIEQIAVGTPRMWEKVSRLIAGISTDDADVLQMFTSLGVGTAIAGDFVAWLKLSKKYDIAGIFKGQEFEMPKDGDVGMLYSLVSAIVGFYVEKVNALKDKAATSPEAKTVNKMSVTLLKIAVQFRKEHTALLMIQAKLGDPLLHTRIQTEDRELYTKFSKTIFAFLI